MPLRLEGGLSFTVDGPPGSTTGTAHADGTVCTSAPRTRSLALAAVAVLAARRRRHGP